MEPIGNQIGDRFRPYQCKVPHAIKLSYGYILEPSHQPIITAYYKTVNIKLNHTQATTINGHSLEDLFEKLLKDDGLPNQTHQSFFLFKVNDYYIFIFHFILPTNIKRSRVINLITFHNLLRKYDVKFFCAGQVCRNFDRLTLLQKSDIVVSEDQLDQDAWNLLSKKWKVPMPLNASNCPSNNFERWILDYLFNR